MARCVFCAERRPLAGRGRLAKVVVGNSAEVEKPAVDDAGGVNGNSTCSSNGQIDVVVNASPVQSNSADEEPKGYVFVPTRTAAMIHAERNTQPRRWVRVGSGASTGAIGTACRR